MKNLPRWARQCARAVVTWAKKRNDMALLLRALIVRAALQGDRAEDIAKDVQCAVSTVYRVVNRFRKGGYSREALLDGRINNGQPVVHTMFVCRVKALVQASPEDFGYDRSTWTHELLVIVAEKETRIRVSVRSMCRILKLIRARRGKPKPIVRSTLSKRHLRRRIKNIRELRANLRRGEVLLDEDEVDIHFNPHIGLDWMVKGQQKTVITPGKNVKAAIAGALNAETGKLTWTGGWSKDSKLFIALLKELERQYPNAMKIHLILDNYSIHKSGMTRDWLQSHPRFKLHFLPPYSPDENRIERLWQDLHANVTRNHNFPTMQLLCDAVTRWLNSITAWGKGKSPRYVLAPVTTTASSTAQRRR